MVKRSIAEEMRAVERIENKEKQLVLRKTLTFKLIEAIENSKEFKGVAIASDNLEIKGKGAWSKYRSGERTWLLPALQKKIFLALGKKYIDENFANELLSEITKKTVMEPKKKVETEYKLDLANRLSIDVLYTLNTLTDQITEMAGRIDYGVEKFEKIHYYATSLKLLKQLQMTIEEMECAKNEQGQLLKREYGTEDYKEIRIESLSTSPELSYKHHWWIRPMQTQNKPNAKRDKFQLEVKRELESMRGKIDAKK